MSGRWRSVGCWLVLSACVGAATAVRADWLVTRGRTRIETRGAWRVDGARVVFTDAGGRAVTLPLALLDLEASRRATAETEADPLPTAAPEAPTVTLYSASWCGWCRKTRALLDELGVAYVERDVGRDPSARAELLKLTGGSFAVPVLDVAGTIVRGFQAERIRALVTAPAVAPPIATPQG